MRPLRHLTQCLIPLLAASCGASAGTTTQNDSAAAVTAPPSDSVTPPMQAGASAHTSIYAYITGHEALDPTTTAANISASPNSSFVTGLSWVFPWSAIEGTKGQYDWSAVDNAVTASKGRKVMLRIIGGEDSPLWVTSNVPSVTFSFQDAAGNTQTITMPIPWDPGYVADWTAFIHAYGARYGNDARVNVVQMPGGGRIGESSIGDWSGWTSTAAPPNGCGAEPYTNAAMLSAWQSFVDAYAHAFPSTQLAIDDDGPSITGSETVQQPLAAYVTQHYGSRVWFQCNDLGHEGQGAISFLEGLETTTKIGWQEWLGGQGATFQMNAAQTAVSTHATYVEWYVSDVLDPASHDALSFLAPH